MGDDLLAAGNVAQLEQALVRLEQAGLNQLDLIAGAHLSSSFLPGIANAAGLVAVDLVLAHARTLLEACEGFVLRKVLIRFRSRFDADQRKRSGKEREVASFIGDPQRLTVGM